MSSSFLVAALLAEKRSDLLFVTRSFFSGFSGGCYAIQGNLQKISGYIYLVTPHSVDITGDFQDLVHDSSDYSSTAYSRRNY